MIFENQTGILFYPLKNAGNGGWRGYVWKDIKGKLLLLCSSSNFIPACLSLDV